MADRPILFSAPMVRAILAGTKSQTRRVITSHKKAAPYFVIYAERDGSNPRPVYSDDGERGCYTDAQGYDVEERMQCPCGAPGDRLWVRETCAIDFAHNRTYYRADADVDGTVPYLIDGAGAGVGSARIDRWRPSIHMPRWASRITLEITDVRVERLQAISEADAIAEGIQLLNGRYTFNAGLHESRSAVESYRWLWESINGTGSWDANPWVWVISFKMVTP
jgi:hypothetical protein